MIQYLDRKTAWFLQWGTHYGHPKTKHKKRARLLEYDLVTMYTWPTSACAVFVYEELIAHACLALFLVVVLAFFAVSVSLRTQSWNWMTTIRLKENFPSWVVWRGRSLAGIRRKNPTPKAEDSDPWCQQVISRLAPPDDGCFPLIPYIFME